MSLEEEETKISCIEMSNNYQNSHAYVVEDINRVCLSRPIISLRDELSLLSHGHLTSMEHVASSREE